MQTTAKYKCCNLSETKLFKFFYSGKQFWICIREKLFIWKKIGAATKLKRDKIPRSSHKKYHRKEASNSYEVQYTGRDQNLKPSLLLRQLES